MNIISNVAAVLVAVALAVDVYYCVFSSRPFCDYSLQHRFARSCRRDDKVDNKSFDVVRHRCHFCLVVTVFVYVFSVESLTDKLLTFFKTISVGELFN